VIDHGIIISLFIALTTAAEPSGNLSNIIVNEATEFVIDKFVYWVTLGITLSAAVGLGFQGVRWLRKKTAEDRKRENDGLQKKFDEHMKTMKDYVSEISVDAKARRDKDEYMLQQLIKRVENIEEQQTSQMQVVLEGQRTINSFIQEYQKKYSRPTAGRPKKDALTSTDSSDSQSLPP